MSSRILLRRLSFLSCLNSSEATLSASIRSVLHNSLAITPITTSLQVVFSNATNASMGNVRNYRRGSSRHGSSRRGSFSLVLSPEGNPKFEPRKFEPLLTRRWLSKNEFLRRRRAKKQRKKDANSLAPKRLRVRSTKKLMFASDEEKLKDKLERAKMKEALLLERLKRYEVAPVQGPIVKPQELTGEERFYLKKMAKKKGNYAPVGTRGIFGGVILNMHLHWKKHETVNVICKHCTRAQLEEYKKDIARLSGGLPIQTIGNHTIVFYRGKDYEQPKVMSPIDTLSKKKALDKSKYLQSLESVRQFIKVAEEEMELCYRHKAVYDVPNNNPHTILEHPTSSTDRERPKDSSVADVRSQVLPTSGAPDLACQERTVVCNIDENAHL